MGPLSIGVLVSPERHEPLVRPGATTRTAAKGAGGADGSPRPSSDDASLDFQSAADLMTSIEALGHRLCVIPVDDNLDLSLRAADLDLCVLALHGKTGGSGEVQALLGRIDLPFVGPDAAATALAFDKVRARQMLAYHNLPVPASVALGPNAPVGGRALGLLGWPCVLKPRRAALRCGVSHLSDASQVEHALDRAMAFDDELLLERAVEGDEIQIVMLGERVLGAMQVHRGLQTSDDPLRSEMMCPPQYSRSRLDGVHNLARRSAAALGLGDVLTRVDILLSARHNEVVLEVEPLPPLHRAGVVARVAQAAGLDHRHLCAVLLAQVVPPVDTRAPAITLAMAQ